MNIIQMLNSNAFPGRYGWKPKWLILHGTAGGTSAQAIAQYFKNTEGANNATSAHYVIGIQGEIYQCNSESDGPWANGVVTAGHDPWWSDSENPNPNNVTISIEHCKPDSVNATALTSAQQASSFALIKDICERNNIPMRAADANGGITGHYSIDPVNRARCPGPYDWNGLWSYLSRNQPEEEIMIDLSNPVVSQFFTGDDTAWRCKQTGYTIDHGGLTFYRQFGNSGLCGLTHMGLPTSGPIGVANKPGVVYQRFERVVLVFDETRANDHPPGATGQFYLGHIDAGPFQDPRMAPLQEEINHLMTENANLQKQLEAGQIIPQDVLDDIKILAGNVVKLAADAGVQP